MDPVPSSVRRERLPVTPQDTAALLSGALRAEREFSRICHGCVRARAPPPARVRARIEGSSRPTWRYWSWCPGRARRNARGSAIGRVGNESNELHAAKTGEPGPRSLPMARASTELRVNLMGSGVKQPRATQDCSPDEVVQRVCFDSAAVSYTHLRAHET